MNNGNFILIVDDDQNLRTTLSLILNRAGFRTALACEGMEALKNLENQRYDLVFLDLKMPGMDGMEVLQEISRRKPDLPVLVLTANASLESAIQALGLGASGYLLKPIEPEQIINRARDVIRQKQQVKRRREIIHEMQGIVTELKAIDG
ncbi:MAG: response regulator [Chloroflexi bacterium]|nr:MAG: response regulator [Chloroflexota bacterium]